MLTLDEYEKLNPRCELDYEGVHVVYATPSIVTKWRVDTLFKKEPVTIDWIASFQPGEVLVDVGANIGLYTIWAAKTRRVRVFAFEPEAENYALLNRNILLNGLEAQVKAYCVGLSDASGFSELHLAATGAGESRHALGEPLDVHYKSMQPAFSQGCVAARLDDLVTIGALPVPDHVKIDVDGIEPKVIAGARGVLADRKVRSLLIEINRNLPDHLRLVTDIEAMGFHYDPAQVAAAERKKGTFKGLAEYVFRR